MKKNIIVLASLFLLMSTTANALQPRIIKSTVMLTFSDSVANCSGTVSSVGDKIDAELQLWQDNNLVASWPISGTSAVSISKTYQATKGLTYSLLITGTASGSSFSSQPITKTC